MRLLAGEAAWRNRVDSAAERLLELAEYAHE